MASAERKCSPLPWRVPKQRYPGSPKFALLDANRHVVGELSAYCEAVNANADLVVRAVNSHQALVDALKACREALDHHVDVIEVEGSSPQPNWALRLLDTVEAALAQAEGR